jgi:phytoene dehydrogenase-like protein
MAAPTHEAIVVGSGPNGLAAAILLARHGIRVKVLEAKESIGGACRSGQLTLSGFVHDLGSAIHPMAAGSPFFRSLRLERFGLEWIHPTYPLAHPLPEHPAALLQRSMALTSLAFGPDAEAWHRLVEPLVSHWEAVTSEILRPMLHFPRHPFALAQFAAPALLPAQMLNAICFAQTPPRALFAGLAAHSFLPLSAPASSAIGLALAMMGHAVGWPLPRGGAQSITDALAACLRDAGGEIECGVHVRSIDDLPPARTILFDVSAWQFLDIARDRLPPTYRDALTRFQHGPGVFKVDYALDGPVPWRDESCREAGTIHLGGTAREIAASEYAVSRGRIPDRPFVLAAQPSLFDPSRAPAGKHTFWAYCHIPFGSIFDMTSRIEAQIERFAPGFRDRILARNIMGPQQLEAANPNLAGGDISGGACGLWGLISRPVLSPTPYRTPIPGVYLCSSSTPPGGGVHGMCGFYAALAALKDVFS